MATMRNQPQPKPPKPRTLQYLNLRYLITPLTFNAENDQVVLGKIMQLFAEKPVLRGSDLQGNLQEDDEELRIVLDNLAADDLGKLWTTLASPHKLSVSYSVYPVVIQSSIDQPQKPIIPKDQGSKIEKPQKEPIIQPPSAKALDRRLKSP